MTKQKNNPVVVSQEDQARSQQVLTQYQRIARTLRASSARAEAESALTEITTLPEAAQIALLKDLARERYVEAANVLLALYELSPLKEVRKEAKRSLLRLENLHISSNWQPPVEQQFGVSPEPPEANPTRFWKGYVSDSFNIGEVNLMLCWEQGEDSKDIYGLSFLLDAWGGGVKDFFVINESRRSFERRLEYMATQMSDAKMKPCSLAKGRRLLLEVLEINRRAGIPLPPDYRANISRINELILSSPDLDDDDHEDFRLAIAGSINVDDLDLEEIVPTFVESWTRGDPDTAYVLLSKKSPFHQNLSQEAWIAKQQAWVAQVQAEDLQPVFVYTREPQKQTKLWLPSSLKAKQTEQTREVEVSWSMLIDNIPEDGPFPYPEPVISYDEIKMRWFWATFVLVQEDGHWRVQSMTDEAQKARRLLPAALEKKIVEADQAMLRLTKSQSIETMEKFSEEQAINLTANIMAHGIQYLYLLDLQFEKQTSPDPAMLETAFSVTQLFNQDEHSLVLLKQLVEIVPEQRAEMLTSIAVVERQLISFYEQKGNLALSTYFLEQAEKTVQESLALKETLGAHMTFAELLLDQDDRLDEAESHLLQAKNMTSDPEGEGHIEMHLGQIANAREQFQDALKHYQRVVELQPEDVDSWMNLAEAHLNLDQFEEAVTCYQRAIEVEPDPSSYLPLSQAYDQHHEPAKAIAVLEDAIEAFPDSAELYSSLAALYIKSNDYRQAELFLEKAEKLDPESEIVQLTRQVFTVQKSQPPTGSVVESRPAKPKKHRR